MRSFTTLIDAGSLAPLVDEQLVLFDCRFELGNPSWGEADYALVHIAGAQ
jgi:hypothetical protein